MLTTLMDASKKRKVHDNGDSDGTLTSPTLTTDEARKLLESFSHHQLLYLLQNAVVLHSDVLSSVRALSDYDVSRRQVYVQDLGPDTTSDSLKSVFASYGQLDEAVVVFGKTTGQSISFGFVTFKHVDGALLALREPIKRIDGRMTVCRLALAARGTSTSSEDQGKRKIYVENVPYEITAERLFEFFGTFGEIEEIPLKFDKQGGKARGFAFFVYKTEESARTALMEPVKMIDGHQVTCKLAEDRKKEVASLKESYGVGPGIGPVGSGYSTSVGVQFSGSHSQTGRPDAGGYVSYPMPPPPPPPSPTGTPPLYQEIKLAM